MSTVRAKQGVEFAAIAPGGFALLAAFVLTAKRLEQNLEITSGTDGAHTGPLDPHHLGRAYDVRSKDFTSKDAVIQLVLQLADDSCSPFSDSGGFATTYFFGWLEDAGTDNEHFHFQQRHGVEYPPLESNAAAVQDATTGEN